MNDDVHLTELEIYEAALDAKSSGVRPEHVAGCARCAAAVDETRALLASVEALGPELPLPKELEHRLMRRIDPSSANPPKARSSHGRPGIGRWLLQAAAALILFAAGGVTHALLSGSDARTPATVMPAPVAPASGLGPSLALQRAGTEYVAAIARLVADSSRLSEAERRRGREVALAAISGAAFELRLLTNESAEATEIHRLAHQARFPENQPVAP